MPIPEMNEERRKELTSRTAYIRRFPLDYKIADVLEFCSKKIPNYENVIVSILHTRVDVCFLFEVQHSQGESWWKISGEFLVFGVFSGF